MVRGGSRWSVAIGALVGLLFLLPRVAHASTPVSLTLVASPTSAFIEQPVTLTLTTSPVVAGLPITFSDADSSFTYNGLVTDESGSAVITVTGTTYGFSIGEHDFVVRLPGTALRAGDEQHGSPRDRPAPDVNQLVLWDRAEPMEHRPGLHD